MAEVQHEGIRIAITAHTKYYIYKCYLVFRVLCFMLFSFRGTLSKFHAMVPRWLLAPEWWTAEDTYATNINKKKENNRENCCITVQRNKEFEAGIPPNPLLCKQSTNGCSIKVSTEAAGENRVLGLLVLSVEGGGGVIEA